MSVNATVIAYLCCLMVGSMNTCLFDFEVKSPTHNMSHGSRYFPPFISTLFYNFNLIQCRKSLSMSIILFNLYILRVVKLVIGINDKTRNG